MEELNTILISHSHEDRVYASELVNIIKVTGIEKKGVQIICSSVPGHDIPRDVPIYDYLRDELRGNTWVIYLLSQHYYKSAACLNEMGAAWVLQKRYSTFLTPNFDFSDLKGAIDPSKNAYRLNEKTALNDFKNIILKDFDLEVNGNIWESVRDTAILNILNYSKETAKNDSLTSVKIESVRKAKDKEEIEIILRVKNLNSYSVLFTYLEIILKDIEGNEFPIELEIDNQVIYAEEIKLMFVPVKIHTSSYAISKHGSGTVEKFIFHPHF